MCYTDFDSRRACYALSFQQELEKTPVVWYFLKIPTGDSVLESLIDLYPFIADTNKGRCVLQYFPNLVSIAMI